EEDKAGAERACIISNGLWQRLFGSDPQFLGKTLTLNNEIYTVVGILPAEFRYGTQTDVFVPIGLFADTEDMKNRDSHPGIYAIARLQPGVSRDQAETEMKAIAQRLSEQYPKSNTG